MANTITSANSQFTLAVSGLFDTPFALQNYSVDRAFENAAVDIAELQLGVDGILVGGYIPYVLPQTIYFSAASISIPRFESWIAAEQAIQEKLTATGVISIPGTATKYTLTAGYLKEISPMPTAGKVLQARQFGITWGLISSAPI